MSAFVRACVCMYVWMDHGWMDGWMDGRTYVRTYVCMYVCMYVRTYVLYSVRAFVYVHGYLSVCKSAGTITCVPRIGDILYIKVIKFNTTPHVNNANISSAQNCSHAFKDS